MTKQPTEQPEGLKQAIEGMNRAISCLRLELPDVIVNDVSKRFAAVIAALPSPQPESVDALGELVKAQDEYIKFLGNECAKLTQYAGIHHYKIPAKTFKQGELHRNKIAILKALASHPSPSVDAEPSPQEAVWEDLIEDFELMNRLGVYDQMELLKKMKSKYQLFKQQSKDK